MYHLCPARNLMAEPKPGAEVMDMHSETEALETPNEAKI